MGFKLKSRLPAAVFLQHLPSPRDAASETVDVAQNMHRLGNNRIAIGIHSRKILRRSVAVILLSDCKQQTVSLPIALCPNLSQTSSSIWCFSTRDREPWIADTWRDELHGYIGGIIRRLGSDLLAAGSVEDHIHLLFPLPRTVAVSDLVKEVKSAATRWVHESPSRPATFHWQSGYGAFSISPSHKKDACRYIVDRREHHRKVTFQQEYRKILGKYGVGDDERYVWD